MTLSLDRIRELRRGFADAYVGDPHATLNDLDSALAAAEALARPDLVLRTVSLLERVVGWTSHSPLGADARALLAEWKEVGA